MKIVYLENRPKPMMRNLVYYFKVVEVGDSVETMTVTNTNIDIEIDPNDSFEDQLSFIKHCLCEGQYCEETDKEKFDEFFKKTINQINKFSKY